MKAYIKFGGFYDSIHSDEIDWRAEAFEINWEDINYKETHLNYSESWVDRFNNETEFNLMFIGLDSPRFYNYSTDEIIVEVADKDLDLLMKVSESDDFEEWAEPQLRSRDGFASFYNGYANLLYQSSQDDQDKSILISMALNYELSLNDINEDIYNLEFEIITNKQ